MLHLVDNKLSFSSIAIAGIGGAGCNMVQRHRHGVLYRVQMQVQHLAVNTDRSAIVRIQGMPAILLNADASGVEAVMPWLAHCKALYLLAGLGGYAGSTATPALARRARDAGLHTVAVMGMPCDWEGRRRRTTALRALESVREHAAETFVVHGDAVAERLGEGASIGEFIEGINSWLLRELDARMAL